MIQCPKCDSKTIWIRKTVLHGREVDECQNCGHVENSELSLDSDALTNPKHIVTASGIGKTEITGVWKLVRNSVKIKDNQVIMDKSTYNLIDTILKRIKIELV